MTFTDKLNAKIDPTYNHVKLGNRQRVKYDDLVEFGITIRGKEFKRVVDFEIPGIWEGHSIKFLKTRKGNVRAVWRKK